MWCTNYIRFQNYKSHILWMFSSSLLHCISYKIALELKICVIHYTGLFKNINERAENSFGIEYQDRYLLILSNIQVVSLQTEAGYLFITRTIMRVF